MSSSHQTEDQTRLSPGERPPTEIVPLRHPGRAVAAGVIVFMALALLYSMVTNERYQWATVWEYLFHPQILAGVRRTLILTVASMTLGILLGIGLAVCRISANKVLSMMAGLYLWFFRGTPLLIQLIILYNFSALYPRLGLVIPFGGPEIIGAPTNQLLSIWLVAILGLTLNESAYMAEIIRGGLLSVPKQQTEAARALGMTDWQTFRRIVLPQALRVIVPPTGNQVIGMLKYSSLVSVIALPELLYSAQLIYTQNFQTIPLLIVVSLWYLTITSVLSTGQGFLERHFGRGVEGDRLATKAPRNGGPRKKSRAQVPAATIIEGN